MSDSPAAKNQSWLVFVRWPLALAVAAIIIGAAAPFWNVPLNRDQGVYATCADTLLRGGVPYRDCWDTKGPALHYTYALAQLLFGHFTGGAYIINAIAIAATALVIAALAHRWFASIKWAYAIGLIYGLLAIAVRFDMNAQPESFANLLAVLGLLGIHEGIRHSRSGLYWAAGALLAIAVFYKYALALPYGITALALIALHPDSATVAKRIQAFALTTAGSLALVVFFGLYLLATDALDDALLHLRFILFYFPKAELNPQEYAQRSKPLVQTLLYLGRLPVVWGIAVIGAVMGIAHRRWYAWVIASYLAASVVVVWGQQRFTPYHWTVGLPAVAMGIGILVDELRQIVRIDESVRTVLVSGLLVAVVANIAHFLYVDQWLILGKYITGRETRQSFFETHGVWDHAVAAEYIRERTEHDEPIWVWGHHTAIYFLAERQSPTRFIYNEPLLMHLRGGNPWQAEWRADLLDDLYRDPPVYLLLTTFDRTFFDFQNPNVAWEQIEEYNAFTETHYLKEFDYGRFQFYRLIPYWGRQNEREMLDEITLIDLVAQFHEASIEAQSDPPIEVLPYSLPGEANYDAIRIAPTGKLIYSLEMPESPVCLRFDTAMFPDSWQWGGDGASFAVSIIDEAGVTSSVFGEYISNAPEDQRWHENLIDLSAFGGQSVMLIFETGPGPNGDFVGDWAGWGMPRIVQPPAGDQCDTNAIVDMRTQ